MKKPHAWTQLPKYRTWVKDRDRALEQIHRTAQLEATDQMRFALTSVLMIARSMYQELKAGHSTNAIDSFERQVKEILRMCAGNLFVVMNRLRLRSYLLAKASEGAIIAQYLRTPPAKKISFEMLSKHHAKDSFAGGAINKRITVYMDRLSRKIVTMAQSSALNAKDLEAYLIDVVQAFPQKKRAKVPRRILKPELMTEAGGSPPSPKMSITVGTPDWQKKYNAARSDGATSAEATDLLSEDARAYWDDLLNAYKDEYVPKWRAPEYVIDIPIIDPSVQMDGSEVWYAWEFERDMTNEFVKSVREGQIESANENGITDFVWIAIIDSATCDDCCGDYGCRDFDGLLISEIEKMTGGGTTAAPAHFNCRCTLAPATENIPDKPDDGSAEFEQWLES